MTTAMDDDGHPSSPDDWDDDDRAAIAQAEAAGFRPTNRGAVDPQARLFYSRLVPGDYMDVLFAAHRGGHCHRFEPPTAGGKPGTVRHTPSGRLADIIATVLEWPA